MRFFAIAFFAAIGWSLGKDVYKGLDMFLDKLFYEQFDWYRKAKDENHRNRF